MRIEALARRIGPGARPLEPLRRHTSYRIGGPADLFYVARTRKELEGAIDAAIEEGVPWRVIGSASNILVSDDGVEGLVIKTAMRDFRVAPRAAQSDVLVHAEAGALLAAVATSTALGGLSGLEWATSVPGTVGAAVVNNSGAHDSCIAERLVTATLHFPLEGSRTATPQELGLDYRRSHIKDGVWSAVVVGATFRVIPADRARLRARLRDLRQKRRATQPPGFSVGSIFQNPPGMHAGRLIEECGLKGHAVGDAVISQLHGNFVLNRGAARARDVLAAIQHAQRTVHERTGLWLKPEIQLIGRWRAEEVTPIWKPIPEATL